MNVGLIYKLLFVTILSLWAFYGAYAGEPTHASQPETHSADSLHETATTHETSEESKHEESGFDAGKVIVDHITDSHEWHFYDYHKKDGTEVHGSIPLPVILYSPGKGVSIFSYKKFHHGHSSYKGYKLVEGKIVSEDGSKFYDFSLTKNVIQMLIAVALMLLLLISVARNYNKYGVKAPRGLQSVIEVIVIFIRDEVAKPMLGAKYQRYLPYLLTIFFFIWINNMLGLFPGSANVTGNIAVTMTLAMFTFIILLFSSRKPYWKHIFAPPGVPLALYPILVPIEFLSVFIKPFALLIRLFANMTAGHLIVLSFLMLIFIFSKLMGPAVGVGVSIFSVAFAIFIYFLELLVAVLQAYIFTILSALFIGDAAAEGHEEHH